MRDTVELPPLLADLDVGIVVHDPGQGVILGANERTEDLYGYSSSELRTMTIADFTAPSTRFSQDEAVRRIRRAADGDQQVFEWRIERNNGERRWLRVHLTRTTIDAATYVIAQVTDITEYRARERRLRLLSRILRHNLRNRMTVLMGYADTVRGAIEDESVEDELETIVDITREVGTLSKSVRQLEEIANPDVTERRHFDLRQVVEDVVQTVEPEYTDIDITVAGAAEVLVVADEGLTYAVEQGLRNAIEHNDQETPVVSITIERNEAEAAGEIRIADNGPPIPPSEIEVLDDEVETNSTYHGSGVGLWVMQWCLTSLGGELRFEENDPRGNVVSMLLPRADGE
ncbi:PAS domain-containing sensor histidine kinase [Haloarchaeobius amylolyticus]|uniref:PAS domain-containing sensor histidine kinase n=1 Tax=Haloarchaeobius amylolyticus TaxID=1198296 RepID=UPI00226ECD6A|nr:PAS domain-containing sensor histidine kinase [Haloarchaeobius amylolyticus]